MLSGWRRPRLWFFVLIGVATPVAIGLVWFLHSQGRERADQWASVIFGATSALAAVVTGLVWLWRQDRRDTAPVLSAALAHLARAQTEQWTAEQVARRVQDPWPLNVRWLVSPRARAVMASWASVRGVRQAAAVSLDGSYDEVTAMFGPDSPSRLVILGEPGAGKSILLLHLTLRLLDRRTDGDPVPVLLPIAGWHPMQPLDDWITGRLAAGNRFLARLTVAPDGSRRTVARELVARGHILPVLDGLDEMDAAHQSVALTRIATAVGVGGGFVLTSRTRPYEAAVAESGPMAQTAVVELQPLQPSEAAQYLTDGADVPERWASVAAHLERYTGTPLTGALSTPLMVWLARVVYRHRGTDPGELLTADWAATRQGIEKHLLKRLIPAAYTAAVGGRRARSEQEADRAYRWHAALARHLTREKTHDLSWWRINEIRPGPLIQSVVVVLVGFAAVSFPFTALSSLTQPGPGPIGLGIWISLVLGVTVGLFLLLFMDRRGPRRVVPARLIGTMCWTGIPMGLIGLLITGSPLGVLGGVTAALVSGGSTAAGGVLSPARILAADRVACLLAGLTTGAVMTATLVSFAFAGVPTAVAIGGCYGLIAALAGAWGQFGLTRIVLAGCRITPLRLAGFLQEARERGILRQVGGVHQFRHNLLQDHLAEVTPRR